jgi:hypothetical protein
VAFGDVFAGYEGEAAKHWQNVLQMDYQNKRQIAENYSKIADDPRYDEETQAEAQKRSFHTLTFGPGEKLPKEYENFTFTRKPQTPAPVQMPGGPQGQGAPIPSQLPGANAGPVPELGQVGPETSLQSLQGAPGPTSPTAGVLPQPQTVQPPTPPPQQTGMAPMPFAQQVARTGQEAVAKSQGQYGIAGLRASIPVKQGVDTIQGEDGRRYHNYIYQRYNPAIGQMERFEIKEDQPLGFFAPRSGATNTVSNLQKWAAEGNPVLSPDGKPLNLDQMDPGALLQHIGEDRYVPLSEKKELRDIGGMETPYGATSGTVGAPVGYAQGSLPTSREATVPIPGGGLGKTTLTTTKGVQSPTPSPSFVPGAPIPPLGQQQNVPPGTKQANPAAPVAPPSSRGVTSIPGAGRGLTAEEVIDQGKKAEAFANTVDRAMGVMDYTNDPKNGFNDFLNRMKLAIDSNPATPLGITVANMGKVSKQDAKFVADFSSLAEDINVLRSTYGATGFRGADAFEVLLGQRGSLLGNPEIFKQTLKNTLQSVVSQLEPIAQGLTKSGASVSPHPSLGRAYNTLGEKAAVGPNGDLLVLRNKKWVNVMTGKPGQ